MSEDYYKILSVEPTASQKEIQQAADTLISNWGEKRGQSNQKRSEILFQIRKASAVLTDPLQRYEYDIKHGFKRDFSEQSSIKKSPFIPLKYSESIETMDTVKISGGLDYEKLEKSIAMMETADLVKVKDLPDIKPLSKSASLKNARNVKVIDEISKNRPGSETDADIIRESDRFKENSSNLKQDLSTDDLETSGKETAMPLDVDKVKEEKKTIMETVDLTKVKDLPDIKPLSKSISLENVRNVRIIDEISKNRPGSENDADIIRESDRFKENSSNLKQDLSTDDLETSGKETAMPHDVDKVKEEKKTTMETVDLTKVKDLPDIKPLSKSVSLKNARNVRVIDEISKNRPGSENDADIIRESDRFKENSSNLKQDLTTDDLETSGKETAMPLDVEKVIEKKKTIVEDWKDSISATEISSGPVESVKVTKRIAGTDVETVYSFGSDTDFIEVFVNGGLRVKIVNDESHDMYCNDMKHDELPPGVIVGTSTAIAANSCIVTTEVTRRGKRESIAVYKNDTLICRTGSAILED